MLEYFKHFILLRRFYPFYFISFAIFIILYVFLVLHRKMHYKLSTDEKEQIAKAEREKRRKIRLLQVSFTFIIFVAIFCK